MKYAESGFRFVFGPSWQHVEHWDTCRGYLDGIGTLNGELDDRAEGTKAVDFVGVRDHEVWFFEIKDFRNRPIEHKVRSNELPLEVALKARDTVADLIGRHRHDVPEPWIAPVMDGLLDRAASLTVVALIAHPGPWRSVPERQLRTIKGVIMKKTPSAARVAHAASVRARSIRQRPHPGPDGHAAPPALSFDHHRQPQLERSPQPHRSGPDDQVRMMDVALAVARICADAGEPTCP